MFQRYRTFLMEAADGGATGGSPPAPAVPGAAPTAPAAAAPVAPAHGEEFKGMTLEQFNQRLAKERELATKGYLKETGFSTVDEAKTFYAKAKEDAEAKKSVEQKTAEKLAALEPMAKKAEGYEKAIKAYLDAEEKLIPEDKRPLLDLAPPIEDPQARLDWISKAKAKGLFAAAAAPAAPAPTAPANTRAGSTPPPPAPPTDGKHPRDMTAAEFATYEARWKAQNGTPRG